MYDTTFAVTTGWLELEGYCVAALVNSSGNALDTDMVHVYMYNSRAGNIMTACTCLYCQGGSACHILRLQC